MDRNTLQASLNAIQTYLFDQQHPDGYWWANLESNVTMLAEVILLHKIWGLDDRLPWQKAEQFLRQQQQDPGGWELFRGDGGDLSTSVEGYLGLRLLGVPEADPALVKAKNFILAKGGISKTRVFTKMHLALIGAYDWRGIPSIPAWIMLLPNESPFSIYDLSSWARGSTVPLLIVFDQKPVYCLNPQISFDELYAEEVNAACFELPRTGDWSDGFVELDNLFKLGETLNLVPFRDEGLKAAEQWIIERQEASGDWGGIIPAMLNSMLALRSLEYDRADPIVERGFEAIARFGVETETTYWLQPCISPVWDTAWVVRSLVESGIAPDDARIVKGANWLLEQQILDYGDWSVKNPTAEPGGWAFEFENRFYPDLDDSAVVMMALNQSQLPNPARKDAALKRGIRWILSMQCRNGGWAAFDIDNNQDWLNALPYSDLKASIDPPTADVTARILEMAGELEMQGNALVTDLLTENSYQCERALTYLLEEQEEDGSWFGRWGVNYIYGTSGALSALALVTPDHHNRALEQGANWLMSVQNADGGWGETCLSYDQARLKGQGDSTASQTAWALLGLMAVVKALDSASSHPWRQSIGRGVAYLVETQQPDGTWQEPWFTGTGFPSHFYLRYDYYRLYFPLLALGRFAAEHSRS